MKKQFLLGLMAMSLPLSSWAQTGAMQATITTNTWEYDGGSRKPVISVSSDKGDVGTMYEITYSRTNGNGTVENLSLSDVKDAGAYTATVKGTGLIDFYTPTTVTFTITPKPLTTVSVSSMTKVYGDGDDKIKFENITFTGLVAETTAEKENAIKCLKYERIEGHEGVNAGEEIWVNVNGQTDKADAEKTESNYTYNATTPVVGVVTITKRPLTVSLSDTDKKKTYDATPTTISDFVDKVQLDGVYSNQQVKVTVTEKNSLEEVINAATYNLTVALEGNNEVNKNYVIEDGSLTFEIERATLEITPNSTPITVTYGEKDVTEQFDLVFVDAEDEKVVNSYVMRVSGDGTVAATNNVAKLYKKVGDDFEPVNGENGVPNYTISYTETAVTVNPKAIIGSWIDIADENLTYQGQLFNATSKLVVKDGDYTLVEDTDYEIVETVPAAGNDRNGIDANTNFTVKITGKGNYGGEEIESEKEFEIAKADLTITAKATNEEEGILWTREYNGKEIQDDLTKQFNFDGFKGADKTAEDINLKMKRRYSNPSVGKYVVRAYNNGKEVSSTANLFTNYNIIYNENEQKFEITPKALTYYIEAKEVPYTGTEQTPGYNVVTEGFLPGDSWESVARTETSAIVKPVIKVKAGEDTRNAGVKELYVENEQDVALGSNYKITHETDEDGKLTIKPGTVTITAPSIPLNFGDAIPTADDLAKLVQSSAQTSIKNTPSVADDRRALRVVMTLTIDGEDAEAGESGDYDINVGFKAYSDLTEAEKTELAGYGYEGDKAIETLLANYGHDSEDYGDNFVINNGVLSIGVVNELTLDGSIEKAEDVEEGAEVPENLMTVAEKVEKYNGATIKKVTITNLRNFIGVASGASEEPNLIEAEKWYTLALPFDVTVRELSKAFGYAIVNVPNIENTTKNAAYFRLEMQKVPANTLLAFKVDSNMVWKDEMAVTFESKKIVAPAGEYSVENGNADKAGNEFRVVYEKELINDARDWYMYTNGGLFYSSATSKDVVIYPLNGYVHAASDNARIFMQEADGTTTAINAITGESIKNAAEGWYSVDGVKLNAQPTKKGIYINNGKKVVIK